MTEPITPRDAFRALLPELGALMTERLGLYGIRLLRDESRRREDELRREIARVEARLRELAYATRPVIGPSPSWLLYRGPVTALSYSSTGQAVHYARGRCQVDVDLLALDGFEGRVVDVRRAVRPSASTVAPETERAATPRYARNGRVIPRGKGDGGLPHPGVAHYRVEVLLHEELDVEILKRSLRCSLKDWLRATLRRGMNPRVFDAVLPHGTEAKLGLDNFGGDLLEAAKPHDHVTIAIERAQLRRRCNELDAIEAECAAAEASS